MTVVPPVNSLSTEVLFKIFSFHCSKCGLIIATNKDLHIDGPPPIITPTLDLSQTCSRWRSQVTSNPSLWAHMSVDIGHKPSSRVADLIRLYLTRSQPSHLDLKIEAMKDSSFDGDDTDSAPASNLEEPGTLLIFRMLMQETVRCRALAFHMSFDALQVLLRMHDWEEFQNRRMDHLKILEMAHHSDRCPDSMMDKLFQVLGAMPALQSIALPPTFSNHALQSLPVTQLKSVNMRVVNLQWDDVRTVLFQCPKLDHLYIEARLSCILEDGECYPQLDLRPVGNLALRTLSVIAPFKDHPNFSVEDASIIDNVQIIISQCRLLHYLHLSGNFVRAHKLDIDFFAGIRTLEHLSLGMWEQGFKSQLFKNMTVRSGANTFPVLPELIRLDIKVTTKFLRLDRRAPKPGVICDMVESRRRMSEVGSSTNTSHLTKELQHFSLSITNLGKYPFEWVKNFRSDAEFRLRQLANNGLSLELDLQ
ncbi:hypothetical protein VKT23_008529 [Stygiomarasmius scandens]|uniref:F-box domain-containing protein n=1 Tax=Marasmiellus scandens TaxID=2682957 RepID=A0ABR1JM01_9AGAR